MFIKTGQYREEREVQGETRAVTLWVVVFALGPPRPRMISDTGRLSSQDGHDMDTQYQQDDGLIQKSMWLQQRINTTWIGTTIKVK